MQDAVDDLVERAMALSVEKRSRLIVLLIQSLDEPDNTEVEKAWSLEVKRRLAEYDRGESKSVPAEQVMNRLKQMLANAKAKAN